MCNGGIECSLKYLLITCFTRHCHKFTLPSFIVLTADTVDTVQMASWVWLKTKRCQWTYALNLHVLVQTIFMFENSIWTASCATPYLSSKERWEPASASKVSCFLLCEADITSSHPRWEDYQDAWVLLQRSSAVLDRFFRFPKDSLDRP